MNDGGADIEGEENIDESDDILDVDVTADNADGIEGEDQVTEENNQPPEVLCDPNLEFCADEQLIELPKRPEMDSIVYLDLIYMGNALLLPLSMLTA